MKHQVETKYLQIDFNDDEHIYDEIENFLKGYDIAVLVNNVGVSHPPKEFLEISNLSKNINAITRVNIISLFKVMKEFIFGLTQLQMSIIEIFFTNHKSDASIL